MVEAEEGRKPERLWIIDELNVPDDWESTGVVLRR